MHVSIDSTDAVLIRNPSPRRLLHLMELFRNYYLLRSIILAFRPIFDVIRVIAVDFSIRRWLGVVIPAISYPLGARLDSNRSRIRLYGLNFGFTPCNSDPGRRPWCNNMSCRLAHTHSSRAVALSFHQSLST